LSQFTHLALKLGDPLLLCGGHAWRLAAVDIGLLDPVAQRLGSNPELASNSGDRSYALAPLGDRLAHHAHRSLTHLRRVAALETTVRCCHGLLVLKG
jgi:hypothetical protein